MTTVANVHLDDTAPTARLFPESKRPFAAVSLDDNAAVLYAHDPAHLRAVAQSCIDAAQLLADHLDRVAGTAVNAATTAERVPA